MSLVNDAQQSLDQPAESTHELPKKFKITYARDFLLSLSELDVCQKLPSGFDEPLLSEFEDASHDRPRIGGLSLRRNEFGSSPPTRGDMGNFSRGVHGRWDSHSSGRNVKESDSQSELDSDSGKRYGNQPRRSWQVPEHDGLLGSGSFPRTSGFVAGASLPKTRANDQQALTRSNEPYHPPRPFKAVPQSRRETDSLNDETFGSLEHTSEDRAEEERKRRASFELMRKEHQKAFQEKQKLNLDKPKDDFDTLAEDFKEEKALLDRSNISNEPVIPPALNNGSVKSSFPSQTSASRPRVPPGFAKNFGAKSLIHPRPEEVRNPAVEDSQLLAKSNHVADVIFVNPEEKHSVELLGLGKQLESTSEYVSVINKNEKILNASTTSDDSNKTIGTNSLLPKTFNIPDTLEVLESREVVKPDAENFRRHEVVSKSNSDHSGSILEKLFGNALPLDDGGPSTEFNSNKEDKAWSHRTAQSSKFAHWFVEEEKKPIKNISSGRPSDLLSLIVGEKGGSQVSDVMATEHVLPNFLLQRSMVADGHMTSNLTPTSVGNSEQLLNNYKPDVVSAFLTCEDLEQSILSEISESASTLPQPIQGWDVPDTRTELPKIADNSASQHLLSLLQKGTGLQGLMQSTKLDTRSSDELHNIEVKREANEENAPNSENSLTLETLFGTAFMKELQSVGAPVSIQRGSAGSTRHDVSEPNGLSIGEDGLHSSAVAIGSNRTSEGSVLTNQRRNTNSVKTEEHWLGFDDRRTEMDTMHIEPNIGAKLGRFDGPAEFRLPEEDSLIINEQVNPQNFMSADNSLKAKLLTSSNGPVDLTEKLAALNSALKDERCIMGGQEEQSFHPGPYDMRESDVRVHQSIHGVRPSSGQLHHPQLHHMRPLLHHPLQAHPANVNSQMKFPPSEGAIHRDPPNRHFPPNALPPPFHHPSTGLSGFDPPGHHHSMLQQMHMAGNVPPPHLMRGYPRVGPVAPHPSNQTGFMLEPNPMQGFPHGHQQPNFGSGTGIPLPDAGGSNHPEALQMQIEREVRAKSKQMNPYDAAQGMYGHELDMGFRYR